jgi:hypothetical protein
MTRKRSSARTLIWGALAFALLALLGAAEALVRHSAGEVAVILLLPVAAFLVGRRSGFRPARAPRALPRRDRNRADLAELRGQVAELEDAAGRPLAVILASYRRIQGQNRAGGDQ